LPSVFFSYSHADEELRDQLEKQLAMLKRQGVIETWHDRRIGAGENIDQVIDDHINSDEVILLLISADFLASDYCYDIEMMRAMGRHRAGEAIVIPVILRACDWHYAPFGKLNAAPRDGKPITQWPDIDEAFFQVAKAVREAAMRFARADKPLREPAPKQRVGHEPAQVQAIGPRSSNFRLGKTFTQQDKDKFQIETFEFIARFFENSLSEFGVRNAGFEGVYRRVDANRFFATIYQDGKAVARATIYVGGEAFSRGINYAQGETMQNNAFNESLTVQADDQSLYLKTLGIASLAGDRDQKLSQEGAAEVFWSILFSPLQRSKL
jgi:hypothetical protein